MINNLIKGMQYFGDGMQLLKSPGIKRYVFIPLLINIILFSILLVVSYHYMHELNDWVNQHIPAWLHWLSLVLWLVFFVSFFLIVLFSFVTLTNIIGAPFNSLLAEKIQVLLTGNTLPDKTWREFLHELPALLGRQLALLAYYLPRVILLGILFFIPVVQLVAGLLWLIFHAWMMSIQHMDYPMDNNRITFKTMRTLLATKRGVILGFGSSVLFFSFIPVINFLVVPAAVAGATKLYVKEYSVYSAAQP